MGVVGSHSVIGISRPVFPLLYNLLTLLTLYTLSISQSLRNILARGKQSVKETEANERTTQNNSPPSSLSLDHNFAHSHLEGLILSSDFNQGNQRYPKVTKPSCSARLCLHQPDRGGQVGLSTTLHRNPITPCHSHQ